VEKDIGDEVRSFMIDGEDVDDMHTDPDICEVCGAKGEFIRDYMTGEITCTRCGAVRSGPIINMGPEWRRFSHEENDRIRTKPTDPRLHDKGLGTTIKDARWDAGGREIDYDTRSTVRRLQQRDLRSKLHAGRDRHFANAMNHLSATCSRLHIPDNISKETAREYEKVMSSGITRGRTIKSLITATLYLVCRQMEHPTYGGWGGRFYLKDQSSQWWGAKDDNNLDKPIYRWSKGFQNDFAARMDWCIKSYQEANHPPVPVLGNPEELTVKSGQGFPETLQKGRMLEGLYP